MSYGLPMCVHGLLRLLRFRSHFSCTECDAVISPGRKVEKEVLKNYTTLKVYYTTLSNSSKLHACSGAVRSLSLVICSVAEPSAHVYRRVGNPNSQIRGLLCSRTSRQAQGSHFITQRLCMITQCLCKDFKKVQAFA